MTPMEKRLKEVVVGLLGMLLAGALAPRAAALLGDDFAAIEARYGAALSRSQLAPGQEASVHEFTGYRILVLYRDGKSARETFSKLNGPGAFSEQEIGALLLAHAAGEKWEEQGKVTGTRVWGRPTAVAAYVSDGDKSTLSFEKSGGGAVMAADPATGKPKDMDAATGGLSAGKLELGKVQTGKVQTGSLSSGHLGPAK